MTVKMLNNIVAAINGHERFLVLAHEGPDGDAMGSTLALTNILREMGKQVVAFNVDGVPAKFSFLPGAAAVRTELAADERFDVAFVLDAGELRRAGIDVARHAAMLVNVDHHPHSEDFGAIYYVDSGASATAALVYRILCALQHPLSLSVATCIYTGILADTGSFRYSSADPEAFAIAGEMVAAGVEPWQVAGGLYESQELKRLQLLGLALNTIQVSPCGRFAAMYLTREMFAQVGVGAEYADSFVNYPRSVNGVEVALFFRQLDGDSYRISMRSKGQVDVGALARELGGGGHHNAAGAEISGDIDAIVARVFERLGGLLADH